MPTNLGQAKFLSLECIELNAAGIDVGATEIYVAVPPDRDAQPVRRFKTFTDDLRQMAAWLVRCRITTAAMESTGVYWIPPHEILEEAGLLVCLVNSKHVKHVPGRKSDIQDCQWLQYLHSAGLLKASFRPESQICAIRALRVAAQTLARSRLGNFYRSMRARLGAPQAITATAHKLARIVYHLLATGQAYDESVFPLEDQKQAQRHEKRLRKQAQSLGFLLVPVAA